jgi:hypothetical protein
VLEFESVPRAGFCSGAVPRVFRDPPGLEKECLPRNVERQIWAVDDDLFGLTRDTCMLNGGMPRVGSQELKRIDAIARRRGLLNRSDLVWEAIRLYLSLSSLEAENRLRMLRLINESVGVSGKTAAQLVDESRREEDG